MAGLDPEDVGALLSQEQSGRALTQRTIEGLMQDAFRKRQLASTEERAAAAAKARVTEAEAERKFRKEMSEAKSQADITAANLQYKRDKALVALRKAPTQEERKKLQAEIDKLDAQKAKIEAETAKIKAGNGTAMTEFQKKQIEFKKRAEAIKLDERAAIARDLIMAPPEEGVDPDEDFQAKRIEATLQNQSPNSPVFYMISDPVDTAWYDLTKWDKDGEIIPVPLPLDKTTGKQITSKDVQDTAKHYGKSTEEVLKKLGALP